MCNFIKYSSIFFCLWVFHSCKSKSPLPDLKESYSYKDNNPFGASVAYNMIKNAYPNKEINFSTTEFSENLNWIYDKSSLYLSISKNYLVNAESAESLMSFVYKGNTALIAASNIDSNFLNTLSFTQSGNVNIFQLFYTLKNTSTSIDKSVAIYQDTFSYFYKEFNNEFPGINSEHGRYIGENKNGKTNLFVYFYGKGRFIFHAEPRALSNYFLLTNNNYLYWQSIIKMLPSTPQNIYWDNFYTRKNYVSNKNSSGGGSLLGAIFKSSALIFAFLALLALFVFYLLFNSKRKQRIVPIVKLPENSSIAFAEAIAGLYLNKKDNKVIADKMITYFNEYLRTKFYFATSINDESYVENLCRKSGVPFAIVEELTNTVRLSYARLKINDEDLLNLNVLIENFLKHKN